MARLDTSGRSLFRLLHFPSLPTQICRRPRTIESVLTPFPNCQFFPPGSASHPPVIHLRGVCATMSANPLHVQDLSDLRNYVQQTLCDQNQLELGAFEVTERILVRGRRPCGIFFCLHGPRSVKLTAIWETDRNTVLFYSSSGERVQKTQLVGAPALVPALV